MAEDHVNVGVNVDVNVELERLLARAGWTPEDLGDQLNRLASSMKLRAHINRQSVRRWVHAMPSCPKIVKPSEPWPALVCHLLEKQTGETVTPAALGWGEAALCVLAADHGLDQLWTCTGALDAWAQVMDAGPMGFQRRQFFERSDSPPTLSRIYGVPCRCSTRVSLGIVVWCSWAWQPPELVWALLNGPAPPPPEPPGSSADWTPPRPSLPRRVPRHRRPLRHLGDREGVRRQAPRPAARPRTDLDRPWGCPCGTGMGNQVVLACAGPPPMGPRTHDRPRTRRLGDCPRQPPIRRQPHTTIVTRTTITT
jgi:hypothetical protein